MYYKSKHLLRIGLNYYIKRNVQNGPNSSDVIISDTCVKQLKKLCSSSDNHLRISVESGGCSGFQYKFDLDSKISEDDRIFEREGVKVVVDETSMEYIKGSTIDYHTELIKSAFRVVQNPNSEMGCSCGASFSVKIE